MSRNNVILIFLLICSAFPAFIGCSPAKVEPGPQSTTITVSGTVTCGGKPLAGVAVSDGFSVVTTLSDGSYNIETDGSCGYVFVTLPAGYTVSERLGALGQFYRHINLSENKQTADFVLKEQTGESFRAVVAADLHLANINNAPLQFKQFCLPNMKVDVSDAPGPVYGIILGDLGTESKWYSSGYDLNSYLKDIEPLGAPVFHVMGNHDNDPYLVGDWPSASTFRSIMGPAYYSANIGKWHFLFLDNIVYRNAAGGQGSLKGISDYSAALSSEVLDWTRKDMALVGKDTPVCICMHSSFDQMDQASRESLLGIISGYGKAIILSGHHHHSRYYQIADNIEEHNIPSVTGATWESFGSLGVHICHDGVPGSYRVYDFDGKNVKWQQYAYDYDKSVQFRMYDMNKVPSEYGGEASSNKVLVNVFGWDSLWKVEASQGGTPLEVTRVYVNDPLYKMVYKIVYPEKTGGMYIPANVSHMFSVTATDAASTISLKVTDRFGNVWAEEFARPADFKID
ncbi:MAG: calcineurin-like phosphoesterase family protein [Bacteroidales bacterium]|nr:calcineurin-like phosphoesterase family protein [Bacteroidales bacterium]